MKTAIIFYSLDGNCAFVAKQIATQLNATMIHLQLEDEKKRRGFIKMLWGCKMMFSRKNPPLKPYTFDPAEYDLLIVGAPVWAGLPAAPLRTFVSGNSVTGKKIALFVCHAGGQGKALEKFGNLFAGNDIVAKTDFNNPATQMLSEELKQQIADWAKGVAS